MSEKEKRVAIEEFFRAQTYCATARFNTVLFILRNFTSSFLTACLMLKAVLNNEELPA